MGQAPEASGLPSGFSGEYSGVDLEVARPLAFLISVDSPSGFPTVSLGGYYVGGSRHSHHSR